MRCEGRGERAACDTMVQHATQEYDRLAKPRVGAEQGGASIEQTDGNAGWGAKPPMASLKDSKSQPACGEELWRDGTMMAGHDGRT